MRDKKQTGSCLLMLLGIMSVPILLLVNFIVGKQAGKKIEQIIAQDNPAPQLIMALDSKNPHLRREAEEALAELGDPLLQALVPACNGEVVAAAAYNPSLTGEHPLVYMNVDGTPLYWTYKFLKDYGPTTRQASDVQLVVCASENSNKVETCSYHYGYERIRIQRIVKMDIWEAASGEFVISKIIKGPMPDKCPSSINSSNPTKSAIISGGLPDEDEVRAVLESLY